METFVPRSRCIFMWMIRGTRAWNRERRMPLCVCILTRTVSFSSCCRG